MSFQVYLQRFHNDEPAGISLDHIRQAFPGMLTELEEDYWQIIFSPDLSSDLFLQFLSGSDQQVHVISIDRLNQNQNLWHGVFKLLENEGVIFHFPGIEAPLARAAVSSNLGKPILVKSADVIAGVVEAAQVLP